MRHPIGALALLLGVALLGGACGESKSGVDVESIAPVVQAATATPAPQPTPPSPTVDEEEREPAPQLAPAQAVTPTTTKAVLPGPMRPFVSAPVLLILKSEGCPIEMPVYQHPYEKSGVDAATGRVKFDPDSGWAGNWVDEHVAEEEEIEVPHVNPGEVGFSMIGGHIFDEFSCLKDVVPGDKLVIVDDRGSTITFKATQDPVLVDKETVPWGELWGERGDTIVNLVTCGLPEEGLYQSGVNEGRSIKNRIVNFELVSIEGVDPYGNPLPTYYEADRV